MTDERRRFPHLPERRARKAAELSFDTFGLVWENATDNWRPEKGHGNATGVPFPYVCPPPRAPKDTPKTWRSSRDASGGVPGVTF